MAALSPAAPARPIDPVLVTVEGADDTPGPELGSAVGVQDTTSQVTASGGGVLQRGDGQAGLHLRVDGVADDPVGPDVLDRAQVELALGGVVLGDVGQPQPVRASAVKSRWTKSSCTGGPTLPPLPRRLRLPNALHQPLPEQIRHAVRSAIGCPASRAS